eukprot:CAMPEP_0204558636 /NCGR_PEP_ID=MMETSP0661-20131031/31263_1 /ASSEMBLY_ACC=CAM_ASM_000606 /TAXON_ID=109239 /ORGANISM="Alexandrium margalefi, Strain AMGDE01CS-322" /LENGTH=45 /DNA_ID= /DNA_START= /DNA_END= /DNA_ORIENTATION=
MEEMDKQIMGDAVKKALSEIVLRIGKPAITLFGNFPLSFINLSGK